MAEEVLVFSREHRGDRPGKSTLCLQSDGRFAQTIESLTSDAGNPAQTFSRPVAGSERTVRLGVSDKPGVFQESTWRQTKRGRFTYAPADTEGVMLLDFHASGVETRSPRRAPGTSSAAPEEEGWARLSQRWGGRLEEGGEGWVLDCEGREYVLSDLRTFADDVLAQ